MGLPEYPCQAQSLAKNRAQHDLGINTGVDSETGSWDCKSVMLPAVGDMRATFFFF